MEGCRLASSFQDLILSMQEKRHIGPKHVAEFNWRPKLFGYARDKVFDLTLLR